MTAQWMHYIDDQAQSSDDATARFELPNQGALHSIMLKAKCTNGSTAGRNVNILDVVDQIDVIGDGSQILFSLKPTELKAWHETLFGQAIPHVIDEAANAVQEMTFTIPFGRRLYDGSYFLPLEFFKDVKLEIAYSPTIAADAGFATGTTTFDIMLLITHPSSSLNYRGSLITRRIKNFTSLASGEDETEIPTRNPLRAIGVFAYESAIADNVDITKLVFSDRATGKEMFSAGWDDFANLNYLLFGSNIEYMYNLLIQNNDALNTRIGNVLFHALSTMVVSDLSDDSFQRTVVDAIAGDQLTFDSADVDVTAGSEVITANTVDLRVQALVKGKFPSNFGLIPFLYDDNWEGWLDLKDAGRPVVTLTQGAAGAEVNISIQEGRRFP